MLQNYNDFIYGYGYDVLAYAIVVLIMRRNSYAMHARHHVGICPLIPGNGNTMTLYSFCGNSYSHAFRSIIIL